MVHTTEENRSEVHPPQILRAAEIIGRAPFGLVLDLDEVVWETVKTHYDISRRVITWLCNRKKINCPEIPTYKEVCQSGGTVPGFKKVIDEELNLRLNRALRHSIRHQRNLPLLHPRIPVILEEARKMGFVPGLI